MAPLSLLMQSSKVQAGPSGVSAEAEVEDNLQFRNQHLQLFQGNLGMTTSTNGNDDVMELEDVDEEEINEERSPPSAEGENSMDGDGSCEAGGSSEAGESIASSSASASKKTRKTPKKKRIVSKVPVSRVSAIMRTCPNLTTVKGDAVALTSHAAELFVRELVQQTIELAEDPHHLTYNDLAAVIEQSQLTFLRDAIPPKMTARQYYQLRARQEQQAINGGDDDNVEEEEGESCGQVEEEDEEED